MRYIALLRGINVGGKNKLPMADLRALCTQLGWQQVQSYIQSGNVTFESDVQQNAASDLSSAIKENYGYKVPVLVRPQVYFQEVLNNPFLEADASLNPKKLHVTFLEQVPLAVQVSALQSKDHKGDQWKIIKDRVYLYCANGYGRSKLTNAYLEKHLGQAATTRNWKTVYKLAHW